MNCDSTGTEKYRRARCRRKARVKVTYQLIPSPDPAWAANKEFVAIKCWQHYLALEERARLPGAMFRILKAEELTNLDAEKLKSSSDRARYYRRLCYAHHCEEFDKLPNARRFEAAWWVTCEPEMCEVCNEKAEK